MTDFIVQLGDFVFQGFEVPERIPFGGEQVLVTQKLVGGTRVVDAMGRDDRRIEWAGRFQGANALSRARYLDYLRIAGQSLTLTWGEFSYEVVIASFMADMERVYQIPYTISFEVVADQGQPVTSNAGISLDGMMVSDMADALGLGSIIGDATLSSALDGLNTAVSAVTGFAGAASSTLAPVISAIGVTETQIDVLLTNYGNTISGIATLGGIIPGNPIAQNVSALTDQLNSMTMLPNLYNLQAIIGRMSQNTSSAGQSGALVTQAGGDLFKIATDAYGDAMGWANIARANGLTDPQLSGINTIKVPPKPVNPDGVLVA